MIKDFKSIMTNEERKIKAAEAYANFMDIVLPLWRNDPNSIETPQRVAKMFIDELYKGYYGEKPKIKTFENVDKYTGIIFEGDIDVKSQCSHHHMPFFGKAYVAYIPDERGKIIGLSKLNRIVDYFARRAQVQENLTQQIHDYISELIGDNKGIAVCIKATHTCVSHRGVNQNSIMKTAKLSGCFLDNTDNAREEFYLFINDKL